MTKQLEKTIQNFLWPWQILRLFCQFTTPPKNKYLLLLCLYPNPLFFMVNSQIHPYIKNRPHLKSCQVLLPANQHYFLAHDSYVDCREVCANVSLNQLIKQVKSDKRRIKGFISEEAQIQVIAAIKTCPVLEQHYKSLILDEWVVEKD